MTSEITDVVAHRPYPLPESPWVMEQTWTHVLFAHWRVPVAELRRLVPPELEVEEFDGSGWLGIVPFDTEGLRPRGLPPLPFVSRYPELNVRTYVRHDGIAGVYFLSLDSGSALATLGARTLYRLPYYNAVMHVADEGNRVRVQSRRNDGTAAFSARYWPVGAVFEAQPGTLEHFLIERYCLYTGALGPRIFRVDIHHLPWPLQAAAAEIDVNTMTRPIGIELPPEPPVLHFSRSQRTLIWPPELVARSGA
ncbi:MAG: DUF2071 domain-containing protein [Gemmatimonadetes bacterium]|nr:DUF2071 domain-containing protein [Gemmatimonadota bacterium]